MKTPHPQVETIFVYGTLRKGGSNHFRMEDAVFIGEGCVPGRLYRVDWYPGVLLDDAAGEVLGEVYEVDATTLAALDAFEGREYRRVRTLVRRNGTTSALEAWIWEYRMPIDGLAEVPSGDWLTVEPAG